jgi:hypothetical protein
VYNDEPQSAVLARHGVEIVSLRPRRVRQSERIVFETEAGFVDSAVEVAQKHFARLGYASTFAESRPFHVIFGTFMWPVIEDALDPRALRVPVRRRTASEREAYKGPAWTLHPADFGTAEYGFRRSEAIDHHLLALHGVETGLSKLFNLWLEPSMALRRYLAADRPQDIATAKEVLEVIPGARIIATLDYLSREYWSRYCGWPDLLLHRGSEFLFAEVKFSGDPLKEEQKTWIKGNAMILKFPFKLIKVHKTPTSAPS